MLGKAAVADDLPFVTGACGLLGTQPSWDLMDGCDTLLMVGSSFPYSEFLPKEGQARGVQIDLDNRRLGLRYPMEVNLVGDSKLTLQALLPLLQPKDDQAWRKQVEEGVARWWKVMEERAMTDARPINPQRVFWELNRVLPDDAIVCCDSGTVAAWYARDLKFRNGMMGSVSGGLASMGCAMPYVLAAKLAHPLRPAFALVGDGAMQMIGLNALITVADRWKQWQDPRLIVMVLNNGDLNMVTFEQRAAGRSALRHRRSCCPPSRTPTTPGCWACAASASTGPSRWRWPGKRRCRPTGPPCSTWWSTATCRRCRRT